MESISLNLKHCQTPTQQTLTGTTTRPGLYSNQKSIFNAIVIESEIWKSYLIQCWRLNEKSRDRDRAEVEVEWRPVIQLRVRHLWDCMKFN